MPWYTIVFEKRNSQNTHLTVVVLLYGYYREKQDCKMADFVHVVT